MIVRFARRASVLSCVLVVFALFAGPSTPAFAAPTIPPPPFTVTTGAGNPTDGTWDEKHYVDAAKWIVATDRIPNNGLQGKNTRSSAVAARVAAAGSITGVSKQDLTYLRVAYAFDVTNLKIGTSSKNWWNYLPPFNSCNPVPTPQMPQNGMSGFIDPGPTVIDPTATDVYGRVGYLPRWAMYDQGCAGKLGVPTPNSADTTIANWLMGAATTLVAISVTLTRMVSPPKFMTAFDPILTEGSQAMRDALYTPYIGGSITILAALLLWQARKANFPRVLETTIWMLLLLGLGTAVANYPVKAGTWADAKATSAINYIHSTFNGGTLSTDPGTTEGSLLTNTVLRDPWLIGELGSAHSKSAQTYGMPLIASQKYTYQEQAAIEADPTKAVAITKAKKGSYAKIAQILKVTDPDAYSHLTGDQDRAGAGVLALVAAACTTPFTILASALITAALIIWRFCVILLVFVAVFAIHPPLRSKFTDLVSVMGAAIINVVMFSAFGAFDGLCVRLLLSADSVNIWMKLFLSAAVSVILWIFTRPLRNLIDLIPGGARATRRGKKVTRKAWRKVRHSSRHRSTTDSDDDSSGTSSDRDEPEDSRYERPEWTPSSDTGDTTVTQLPAEQPALNAPSESASTPVPPADADPEAANGKQQNNPDVQKIMPDRDDNVALNAPRGDPDETEVIPADQEIPVKWRTDPVIIDGVETYRIWNSELHRYEVEETDDPDDKAGGRADAERGA